MIRVTPPAARCGAFGQALPVVIQAVTTYPTLILSVQSSAPRIPEGLPRSTFS